MNARRQPIKAAGATVLAPMSATAAELLHRLQQEAAESVAPALGTVVLAPRGTRCHYASNDTSLSGLFDDFSTSVYLFRHHGNGSSHWTGEETLRDADGRRWERRIHAVVDNFGDLIEVPA
ncbi:hypothetical protein ABL850_14865 [Variovorax paradoxus]|uniref:hypothetical protein n=1 Tax=Variovorax paradoxus TaxID=34073 RepID=UPI000402F070